MLKIKKCLIISSLVVFLLFVQSSPTNIAGLNTGAGIIFTGVESLGFIPPPVRNPGFPTYRWPSDYDPAAINEDFTGANQDGWHYLTDIVGDGYTTPPEPMIPGGDGRFYGPDDDGDGGPTHPSTDPNGDPSVGPDGDGAYSVRPTTKHTVKLALHPDLSGAIEGEIGTVYTGGTVLPAGASLHVYVSPSAVDGRPDPGAGRHVIYENDNLPGGTDLSVEVQPHPLTIVFASGWSGIVPGQIYDCAWIIWEIDYPGYGPVPEFPPLIIASLLVFPIFGLLLIRKRQK